MSKRPDPLEVRRAKGNPQRRPMPSAPPRVRGVPSAPKRLAGEALEFWNEHAALLRARGQLTQDSRASLIALCECYAEWRELQEDIRAHGRFYKEEGKMERARPALAAYQDADRRLKGWLIEFGLTDASRGKVHTEPENPDEDDPLAQYGLN